ncbi:hypothetical protein Golax_013930, partial [Gossypium laxum]|nr:hypothetical protein [Gossypium laxum]
MKKIKTKGKNEDAATFATWDCGSRLYDSPMTGISHPTDFTPVSIADPTSNSIAKESSSLRSSSQVLEEKKAFRCHKAPEHGPPIARSGPFDVALVYKFLVKKGEQRPGNS